MQEASISSTARMIPYLMNRLPPERKKLYWDDEECDSLDQIVRRMIRESGEAAFLDSVLPLLKNDDEYSRRLYRGGEYYALRKRWFAHRIRDSIEQSVDQILSLGGGFDPGIRWLAESHPGRDWYVVDQPATIRFRRRISPADPPPPSNLHLIPATLGRESLTGVLAGVDSFDPGGSTVILLEALLMYLEPGEVGTLLDELRELLGGSGRLLGSVLGSARGGPLYRGALNFAYWNCLFVDEPLRWTPSEEELRNCLKDSGFQAKRLRESRSWIGSVHPDSNPDVSDFQDQEYTFIAEPGRVITL